MFPFPKKINKKVAEKPGGVLQNPKILEVNLVKDQALISFDWNKNILVALIVFFLAAALVAEIYFGLGWWEEQETAKAQDLNVQTDQINYQVSQLNNQINAALVYKAKEADFSTLLNDHIYWTNFFSWLEKRTLSSVKYDGFSGDLSGIYDLKATAPTYADVSWQVKAFLNDSATQKVEALKADTAKSDDRTKPAVVNFNLSLQVNPGIFKK
jgi:outer membrane murein-binding lipoprotein Lpp